MGDSYKLALDEAKQELAELTKLLDDLQPRRERLIGLVRMLEPMVKRTTEIRPPDPHPPAPNLFENNDPLWKQIVHTMKDKGSFGIVAAGQAVEKMTGKSLRPNLSQKVRNALIRHEGVFRRNEDGTFAVIEEV